MKGQGGPLRDDCWADPVMRRRGASHGTIWGQREQQVPRSEGAQSRVCLTNRKGVCEPEGREQVGGDVGQGGRGGRVHPLGAQEWVKTAFDSQLGSPWRAVSRGERHL